MKRHRLFRSSRLMLLGVGLAAAPAMAQTTMLPIPAGSQNFGSRITVLPNGNYVVVDPSWGNGTIQGAGAVYLFNGQTHALISRLTGGSDYDMIGVNGIEIVGNGNFLVKSPYWNNGAGALTWCSGTTGLNASVSSSNSLLGTGMNQNVGQDVTVLPNKNYVCRVPTWSNGSATDAGAIVWGSGNAGVSGLISSSNALVGSTANDGVGSSEVTVLTNGNYVVTTPSWNRSSSIQYAGAVTLCSGTAATTGAVSTSNSIVGSTQYDAIGGYAVVPLSNGNYVVNSPGWHNASGVSVGASTLRSGTAATTGSITASNSITGTTAGDGIGERCTALPNGNYVIHSPSWRNGSVQNAGAVTWCSGITANTGVVSSSNSIVGSSANDNVGNAIGVLTNGNYVILSNGWNNGTQNYAGAATWCSGTAASSGAVSATNSMVGTRTGDQIGIRFQALPNGNYVVGSYDWTNGTATGAGCVRFCPGTSATTGTFSASNSLVGTTAGDAIGASEIVVLTNGNYVVSSWRWSSPTAANVGAVTWGSGTTGITGPVSASNSLIGSQQRDYVGSGYITPLTNGNYVVRSTNWANGTAVEAGAATWANGATGITGVVSASNSFVGSHNYDQIGHWGIKALSNGNYVINTNSWNNGSLLVAGAVTWGNGRTGSSGVVSATNSIIGGQQYDQIGNDGNIELDSTYYGIPSPNWKDSTGTMVGAYTVINTTTGLPSGLINKCNSLINTTQFGGSGANGAVNPVYKYILIGFPQSNTLAIFRPSGHGTVTADEQSTQTIGSAALAFATNPCAVIATLTPSGVSPVSGDVTAKAFVKPTAPKYNSAAYVRRYYDITPATNPSTATSYVTLYFTQADFDDYNANNGTDPDLPTAPNDATGVAHLRVAQHHGSSITGLPGSFSGWTGIGPDKVVIDPIDANVVWNTVEKRWEVSFDVVGFSGFFLYGANGAAALPLFQMDAKATAAGAQNRIDWSITDEPASAGFEIERQEGGAFRTIGMVSGTKTGDYRFFDAQPQGRTSYYRIKVTAAGKTPSYSKTMPVTREALTGITVAPQPATSTLQIRSTDASLVGTQALVYNVQGVIVARFQLEANTQLDVSSWQPGIYSLRLANGTAMSVSKR